MSRARLRPALRQAMIGKRKSETEVTLLATGDTYLFAFSADDNYGDAEALLVWQDFGMGMANRALIRFDLSSLPDDVEFSSAKLRMYCHLLDGASPCTLDLHRQKRAWVEMEATRNVYATGQSWASPGGFGADDCEQTAISQATGTLYDWVEWELPHTKAAMDLGHGWLIKFANESGTDRVELDSRGFPTTNLRPELVVRW